MYVGGNWLNLYVVFQHPILSARRKGQLDLKVLTNVGYLAFFKVNVYTILLYLRYLK